MSGEPALSVGRNASFAAEVQKLVAAKQVTGMALWPERQWTLLGRRWRFRWVAFVDGETVGRGRARSQRAAEWAAKWAIDVVERDGAP